MCRPPFEPVAVPLDIDVGIHRRPVGSVPTQAIFAEHAVPDPKDEDFVPSRFFALNLLNEIDHLAHLRHVCPIHCKLVYGAGRRTQSSQFSEIEANVDIGGGEQNDLSELLRRGVRLR